LSGESRDHPAMRGVGDAPERLVFERHWESLQKLDSEVGLLPSPFDCTADAAKDEFRFHLDTKDLPRLRYGAIAKSCSMRSGGRF
jgi:hypothetical protein